MVRPTKSFLFLLIIIKLDLIIKMKYNKLLRSIIKIIKLLKKDMFNSYLKII